MTSESSSRHAELGGVVGRGKEHGPVGQAFPQGIDFVVNLSNEAWFGETAEFDQLLDITRFRAVENRIWMVRATNSGISAYINSRGEVEAKVQSGDGRDRAVRGTLKQRIGLKKNASIYGRTGDVFAGLCLAITLVAAAVRLFGRLFGRFRK